jgi:hypothetical protein
MKHARRSPATVACPYCGQEEALYVDPGGGERQSYVEDCAVCCRPRTVHVEPGEDGEEPHVWLEREA